MPEEIFFSSAENGLTGKFPGMNPGISVKGTSRTEKGKPGRILSALLDKIRKYIFSPEKPYLYYSSGIKKYLESENLSELLEVVNEMDRIEKYRSGEFMHNRKDLIC